MASIAIMVGGAVLSAATFIGGNYLARYLSGDDPKRHRKRKFDTTKLLRPTRLPMPNMRKTAQSFSIGLQKMIESKIKRNKISLTPTTLSSSTTKLTHTSKYQCL